MGCRRNPKHYRLKFADGDYEGLEVTMRSVSIGEMRALQGAGGDEAGRDGFDRMVSLVASHMVGWNREDENGQALPPTLESLEDEEPSLINLVIDRWTDAVAGVSAPLEQPSNSGASAPVESIPMEALSPSLAS
ncbi:hypothetical protein AQI95_24600 [Streptomyces yokosukanensis]|uniref:Tail assembly chaperone n=1 Tax=Streptomyces yokosukanensis TaxID=67386 RepID=A0A101P1F5_9ACTN|nr:hypothetical protein [Streptomyces yokosukanensis]KUN03142.1 hypothetical protein AQI95_24600 [Streptomyces yokosukanensis]